MSALGLSLRPSLELGSLQAVATVQDPDIRVELGREPPEIRVIEGVVDVRFCFPDGDAVERFICRVAALVPPR